MSACRCPLLRCAPEPSVLFNAQDAIGGRPRFELAALHRMTMARISSCPGLARYTALHRVRCRIRLYGIKTPAAPAGTLAAANWPSSARLVSDWQGEPIALFESEWSVRLAQEWNPALRFVDFAQLEGTMEAVS